MNKLQTTLIICLLLSVMITDSYATFSIVAVDPATGQLGSAGATCIGAEDGAIVISDIVLGTGVIHTQSFWSPTNQANARTRMEMGDTPQQIMDWLVANDVSNNPNSRQYLAVDLNNSQPRSATFSGTGNFDVVHQVNGPNYAIAGNILLSEDVVNDMEQAFINTNGSLSDKLMAALQGAKRIGADSRCSDFDVSSASAFIRVARTCDTDSSYGNLPLDINVWIPPGASVFEPIDELQTQYDNHPGLSDCPGDEIFTNGFE